MAMTMNYLQQILTNLFTSAESTSRQLKGGTLLEWDAIHGMLRATRLNRGLDIRPDEQAIFEREIKALGYRHDAGVPCVRKVDPLNERIGVRWIITKAAPGRASKAARQAEIQESLF